MVLAASLGDLGVLEGGPDVDRDPTVRARLLGLADRYRHEAATARAHHLVLRHGTHLPCSSYTLPAGPLSIHQDRRLRAAQRPQGEHLAAEGKVGHHSK